MIKARQLIIDINFSGADKHKILPAPETQNANKLAVLFGITNALLN